MAEGKLRVIRCLAVDDVSDNAILWRYMDLAKFVSLLSESSLWLARSDTFKDQREGVFNQAMRVYLTEELESLKGAGVNVDDVNATELAIRLNAFISCWHNSQTENMIMWELYGETENSIAIKTTAANLKSSFDLEKVFHEQALELWLGKVNYQNLSLTEPDGTARQSFF